MVSCFHQKFYSDEVKLTYDDVLLYPECSDVGSRTDVDLSTHIGHVKLDYPLMSAAMDTVTDGNLAEALAKAGGIGVIHRFQSVEDRINQCSQSSNLDLPVSCAIGLTETDAEICQIADHCDIIAIDVAHAYSRTTIERTKHVSDLLSSYQVSIMVGNIVSPFAVKPLVDAGADILKVGIGGGAACTTRLVTGFGYPNLSAILDVRKKLEEYDFKKHITIVADGGLGKGADIAKALAAGADAVMLGRLFAGCIEAPGEHNERGKIYRGMASNDAQVDWKGGMKEGTVPEGVTGVIPVYGTVAERVEDLMGGLRSAFTYADAPNLMEFQQNTQFIKVTSNCNNESKARIIR